METGLDRSSASLPLEAPIINDSFFAFSTVRQNGSEKGIFGFNLFLVNLSSFEYIPNNIHRRRI